MAYGKDAVTGIRKKTSITHQAQAVCSVLRIVTYKIVPTVYALLCGLGIIQFEILHILNWIVLCAAHRVCEMLIKK